MNNETYKIIGDDTDRKAEFYRAGDIGAGNVDADHRFLKAGAGVLLATSIVLGLGYTYKEREEYTDNVAVATQTMHDIGSKIYHTLRNPSQIAFNTTKEGSFAVVPKNKPNDEAENTNH